ncbi:conserved phage C-terminal domain-containing protein [Convivina intestini]|uniref:Putative phage protein (TIGR02220 family) n=1 Tax=Convivina intestini TaxID=1505726 RepID=A0A2U1D307_9LACO|nr:conserved phage C-terminal domain-containing protein [Convivina intestini]PVY81999.1 putative phage protein (TIGR02220 family) [Convivina intestini]SDC24588.1 phage conserved hypothetical protein, C-terminal domain-containing protein [Leuconostocaceae bacterium R-53105]
MEQSYFNIIPQKVMQATFKDGTKLKADAKLLYGIINSLTKKHGYCSASNGFLAETYGCSERAISRYIADLKKLGLIKTHVSDDNHRQIWTLETMASKTDTTTEQSRPIDRTGDGVRQNWRDPIDRTGDKLVNNISKSISKSNKDILSGSGEPDHTPYPEIIDYLNDKADKKFKHKSSKTRKLIKARYNDGFDLDDFKRVIDNKVSEWKGSPDMNQYLRPETLFGTKFESYLNQKMSSNQEKQSDLDRLAAQYGDW